MVRPPAVPARVPLVPPAGPLAVRRTHRATRSTAPSVPVPAIPAVRRSHRATRPTARFLPVPALAAVSRGRRAVPHQASNNVVLRQQTVLPVSDRPLISWYRKRKSRCFLFSY